jgi:hypothetical protein
MTRIAAPKNEAALLNVAEHGTAAQVEKLVRKAAAQGRRGARFASGRAKMRLHAPSTRGRRND